jgi:hypothetical protein
MRTRSNQSVSENQFRLRLLLKLSAMFRARFRHSSERFNAGAIHILDFIQVPGFPSALRVFALTHSRRIVVQR